MTSFSLTTFLVISGFVGLIHSCGSESDFLDNDINRADGVTRGPRTKRVIYGLNFKLIDDHVEDFPSLKYFVVISHAHLCSLKLLDDFIDFFAAGSKNVLNVSIPLTANCMMGNRDPRCSGALIAPNIIQTACHCLATFYTVRNTGLDALEKSVWEDHRIVFRPIEDPSFKYRDSFFSQYYTYSSRLALVSERQFMFTKKFYVHQKCSRLARRLYSHDFGLVFLKDRYLRTPPYMVQYNPLKPGRRAAPPPRMSESVFAPTYTIWQAEENWVWANRVQPTCLFLGTGWSVWQNGVYKELPLPWDIHYVWREMTAYVTCANWIKNYTLGTRIAGEQWSILVDGKYVTYRDVATWMCTFPSRRIRFGSSTLGDDGGPVVCENRFMGVLSSGFPHSPLLSEEIVVGRMELVHSLNYAPESLAEHRLALLDLAMDQRPEEDERISQFDSEIDVNEDFPV